MTLIRIISAFIVSIIVLNCYLVSADLKTYDTETQSALLGSKFFLSVGIEEDMELNKLYQASVSLTLNTFASNIYKLNEITIWLFISDENSNEILNIQTETKGEVEAEGWAWATYISYWTTNFPDEVTFAIGATFFEVDTGGGLNRNTVDFINMHTYSFVKETTSQDISDEISDDSFLQSNGLNLISSILLTIVFILKYKRSSRIVL